MADNDWKKRLGVVYSTNRDFEYEYQPQEEVQTLPPGKQRLLVGIDRRNRAGKTVTLVSGFKGSAAHFYSPYEDIATSGNHKRDMIRVSGVNWFTNLDHNKRHEELDLVCHYSTEEYPIYANYDAIEVSKTSDIPCDYPDKMGVPTTFLDKYNPDQFEIIGLAEGDLGKELGLKPYDRELKKLNKSLRDGQVFYMKNGIPQKPYSRIIIRNKHPKINE